ncbi:DUF4157 domain-containing protein [Ramlibacter sp. USB13]|uniref:DUF4157 domain-containing protein n=1 Tax=Ramlibacter cellulosilyticus TaxID=2764187 RepID=A0A923MQ61_9BURK|nr:DUF4157 domain-containing protein [Ramlibacter cellulosilyticus]MBC5783440.1 DUF4157 domain-containing protein [Ramlibacter cellulosilyticus]
MTRTLAPPETLPAAFRAGSAPATVQRAPLRVSSPEDAGEREATAAARAVMAMGPARVGSAGPGVIQRAAQGPAAPSLLPGGPAGGQPLPAVIRRFMEPRFGADFGAVRIHVDAQAAAASRRLGARAFATGQHIFFGAGQYQPESAAGRELIAHELAHTVQQGAAPRMPVQRSADLTLTPQPAGHVQRLGLSDALDYFADKANLIPGFRMFTIVLGMNPINMRRVERSAANILRAVIEFMPGGALITQALDNHGVFERAGAWVEQQIASLGLSWSTIKDAISRFLDSLGWRDIFDLGGVWDRAKRIFTEPIDRIRTFVGNLVDRVIQFVKDAILQPLARLASNTRGWDLLCAVLGRNPITGETVPRNAETLIGGFMKLIGQEEIWQNIQRGNAIGRAWSWFQGTLSGVLGFVRELPAMFLDALRSLTIGDIVLVPRAFAKVAGVFGSFALRFVTWAGEQVWGLLQIIFEVVAPQVMVYIRRAAGSLRTIIRDPIRFVGNLVRAAMQGLRQFSANFLGHLRAALVGWLTGAMSGANIYIPQAFNLREILKFVLSVLGLTWQNIRQKLVKAIGETAVAALETGFDIVLTLIREGPAAAWEKILESINNLKDLVIEQVMTFVRDNVVMAAITKLVSMLNPAGAFIQAVIAIYNTIMFFVERMRQIAQVAAAVIDSIDAIARGVIGAAATRVEQTMAGLLTLVISFLARIAGLGRVSDAVTKIIDKVRQPIDKALDRVITWIVEQAKKAGRALVSGAKAAAGRILQWWRMRKKFTAGGDKHEMYFQGEKKAARLFVASDPTPFEDFVATVPKTNPARDTAMGYAKQMDAVRNKAKKGADETLDDAALAELEKLWEKLSEQLALCFVGTSASEPQYGATPGPAGWGSGMVMLTLAKPKSPGTKPSVDNKVFQDLNLRRHGTASSPSGASYYILGHLLNMQLGGLGSVWGNITPLSRTGNAQHDQQVESKLRDPVLKSKRVYRYEVQVRYGRKASALLAQIPDPAPDPVLQNKRKVLVAEQYVATSLLVRAQELDTPGRKGTEKVVAEVANVVDQSSLAAYAVPGQAIRRLKVLAINDSAGKGGVTEHKEALMRLPGIGPERVKQLIAGKPYATWKSVSEKVDGVTEAVTDGWRAGVDGAKVVLNGTTTWE